MDERSSKRARQQQRDGGGGLSANGFVANFARTSLAGFHLSVETSQKHLFIGVPIEVNVSLRNDEDVVQHVTQDIHVSITGEDGKVVATHPNMFELTPQHPAIVDGTSTFQLLLWQGCVRAGNRVKVHVEATSGRGEQVKADSEPIMVCRSALHVVTPPPDNWYKDEGGKNNCIAIDVMVREKSPGQSGGQAQPGVPLSLALVYENGTEVHSQNILQMQADTQLVTNEHGRANLKFKITEVSQRHQSQKFCIKIGPDIRMSPEYSDVAPVVTIPIMVLSKRKNRRIKAEKAAQQNAAAAAYSTQQPAGGLTSLIWATANGQLPQSGLDGSAHHWASSPSSILSASAPGRGRMGASPPPVYQQQNTPQGSAAPVPALGAPGGPPPLNPAPVSAPVEEPALRVPHGSTGALQKIFRWTDAVLQLLQMELQWEHIGYECEPDGSASYARPLFRCPLCRVCKGRAQPHQKHAPDCKLRGLLDEFSGQRSADCEKVIALLRGGGGGSSSSSSPPPGIAAPVGGFVARGGGGGGGGGGNGGRSGETIMGNSRLKALRLSQHSNDAALGRGEEGNAISAGGLRVPSHFLPGVQSNEHELIPRGASGGLSAGGGLSIGFSAMFENQMAPSSSGGENGAARGEGSGSLARTGSVAPFVPQRSTLTPAEEKAHFIMVPTTAPEDGGGRSSSSKQLTVFSETKTLLGFYEEKYDVGQQMYLPFQEYEGKLSSSAKRALEAGLQAALDEEGDKSNGVRDAMDTADGADGGAQPKKRTRPTRSTSAAAAAAAEAEAGVKREGADANKDPAAAAAAGGGVRKVYKLADFQGYQEMKEQAFYDWLAGVGQAIPENVFEPEKPDSKAFAKTTPPIHRPAALAAPPTAAMSSAAVAMLADPTVQIAVACVILSLFVVLRSVQKAKDEQTVYPVIAGMAIGNPQYRCTQDQALVVASKCPGLASIKPVLERIYGNSRIGSRYFAVPDFTPAQAAKGDPMFFPADGSYEANPGKYALMICVELSSVHTTFDDNINDAILHAIFADGCAAAVLKGARKSECPKGTLAIVDNHAWLMEGTEDGITLAIKPNGITCTLSKFLPQYIAKNIAFFADGFLKKNNLSRDDVDFWCVHPGGRRIIEEAQNGLGLTEEQTADSWAVLGEYGNMLSPSVMFVLSRVFKRHNAALAQGKPGYQTGMAFSFSPGVGAEGILLRQI
eukprot:g8265.t1